jgi:hypothetical protein
MMAMTLRTEIEALLEEFEHFAYRGAPLDVAIDKLQEILAKTAPRVLTTVEELDSEEASKALCLIPDTGIGIFGLYWRNSNGTNSWAIPGRDEWYSSAELIAEFSPNRPPAFTMVAAPEDVPAAPRRVLTTVEELDSEEAASAVGLIRADGTGILGFYGRRDGQNEWAGVGSDSFFTSSELLADCANKGDEPAFTLIERPKC